MLDRLSTRWPPERAAYALTLVQLVFFSIAAGALLWALLWRGPAGAIAAVAR